MVTPLVDHDVTTATPATESATESTPWTIETPFASGGQFTVGVEEELLLVDDADELLAAGPARCLIDRVQTPAVQGRGRVSSELFASEVEFATKVCVDAEGAGTCLAGFRDALRSAGGRFLAVGLHPTAPFGRPDVTHDARYQEIGCDLGGLLRTPTAALQVHVGLPDVESAVAAYRGLRHDLALFRALAAGSPFWHGQDSGLASARWGVISSYPRSGVPPAVRSWDEYLEVSAAVASAAEVPDLSFLWWAARIQPRLGTVEVRVMDPQPSSSRAVALIALVHGLARDAVAKPVTVDMPGEVLAENDFRVARHGLDARIVDVDGVMRPVRELAAQRIEDARTMLREAGHDRALDGVRSILHSEPEYNRQRRLHAAGGMSALLADLAERTMQAR